MFLQPSKKVTIRGMSRKEFFQQFQSLNDRHEAWMLCQRADWMYAARLVSEPSTATQTSLLRHLFADLVAEAIRQDLDIGDARKVFDDWLMYRENVTAIRGISHELSLASSEAILDDRPAHGALSEALTKAACVCELLCDDQASVEEASRYIEEAAECLGVARALFLGTEEPEQWLAEMAEGLRSLGLGSLKGSLL